jgi:hypothetical protein
MDLPGVHPECRKRARSAYGRRGAAGSSSAATRVKDEETGYLIVEAEALIRLESVDIVKDAGSTPWKRASGDEAVRILRCRRIFESS